jgi:addiction module HigA family antidote
MRNWLIIGIIIEGMTMIHTHPHPGEILKETVFDALNISVTEAARRLAMSRAALSRVLNGKGSIRPDLALRLEKAGVSTARFWIKLQANHDLWRAMQHEQPPVRALQLPAARADRDPALTGPLQPA